MVRKVSKYGVEYLINIWGTITETSFNTSMVLIKRIMCNAILYFITLKRTTAKFNLLKINFSWFYFSFN